MYIYVCVCVCVLHINVFKYIYIYLYIHIYIYINIHTHIYIIIYLYNIGLYKLNFDRSGLVIAFVHRKPNEQNISERLKLCLKNIKHSICYYKYIL